MKLETFLEKTFSEVVIYAGTNLVDYNPNNYVYSSASKTTYTPVQNDNLEIEGVELTQEILSSNVESFDVETIAVGGAAKTVIEVYVT